MIKNGFSGFLYVSSEWIMRFGIATVLWAVFTILGFFIFGIMPATAALFGLARKWVIGERDAPLIRTFWMLYKKEFKSSNILGLALSIMGLVLYMDYKFFQSSEQLIFQLLSYMLIFFIFIYFIVLIYIFPLFVHYDLNIRDYFKNSFLIAVSSPVETLGMIGSILVITYATYLFPGIFSFFIPSIVAFTLVWFANKVFKKVERKIDALV
ncbi:YesL family protein [Bacillus marinisedimentorum]|uniref:YesL family protein n=1 Tax=Bacillus marinisedimentorum TaxID=1821260 RepID=UPI0007E0A869|nr:YesL family protein [Bacillus marinisedimentorum]